MVKVLKALTLAFIYSFFIIYIGLNFFVVFVLGFVGSMATDHEGIKGLLSYIDGFLIFLLATILIYFVLRKLYY